MKPLCILLSLGAALATLSACGTDCESLCQEAQDRDCTTISGDCGQACGALDSIAEPSGCESQIDAYLDCSCEGDVCTTETRCASQENAAATCVASYCLARGSDPDCATLASAF